MSYRLRLLGRFELLSASGDGITISSKKNQALIAVLALANGEPVLRTRLCDLLWEDRGEDQARNSLRQAFTALRKAFAGHSDLPLLVTEEDAAIDTAIFSVDTDQLTNAAPVLPFGEFLEGLNIPGQTVQHWLLTERQRFKTLHADRLSEQMIELQQNRDFDGAISAAQALLETDPLNEAAHRTLIRGYAETGGRPRAIKQFQTCRDLLKAELGIEPDAETSRLIEEIRQTTDSKRKPPAAAEPAAPQISDIPGIAVLPFENMSGNADQAYFSDGLTEDINTALSRFNDLLVIASSSAFAFKGKGLPVTEIARQLHVRYIVEGSVRRAGGRVRVTAQLVDGQTGSQLWSERYDRELEDIFAVQDDIANTVVGTVHGRVKATNMRRVTQASPDRLEAYDRSLRAWALLNRYTKRDNVQAIELLQEVLELEPGNSMALALKAFGHMFNWMAFWVVDRQHEMDVATRLARKAVELEPGDGGAHWALGEVCQMRREFDEAHHHLTKAVELNPNDIGARNALGLYYSAVGEPELALQEYREVRRRDPMELNWTPWCRGIAQFTARNYGEAVASFREASIPINEIHFWLTVSHAHNGQIEAAGEAQRTFISNARDDMAVFPGEQPDDWRDYALAASGYKDPANVDHLIAGLRKAGMGVQNNTSTDIPKIAVLPFVNLSGDPDQDYFSDSITEDITTALSRFKDILVIASSSAFSFKGKGLDATEISSQLDVRHIVEGSVRRVAGRVRVTAQLVDGETGSQLWSERYDRELEDIFAVQDDIANTVVGTVHGRVAATNLRRAVQLPPGKPEAYDQLLRANALIIRFSRHENAQAIDLLQNVLEIEPGSSTALAHKATGHMMNWMAFWVHDRVTEIEQANQLAQRAVELEPGDSFPRWVLGEILLLRHHHDEAHRHLTKAVELNPNDIGARAILGLYYSAVGEPDLALREYEEVRRRDPMELNWTPWLRGMAHYTARNFGEAVVSFKDASIPINEVHFWLAVSYAHQGQSKAAGEALQTFLDNAKVDMADFPGEQPDDWRDYALAITGYRDPANIDHLIEGLRKAGLAN